MVRSSMETQVDSMLPPIKPAEIDESLQKRTVAVMKRQLSIEKKIGSSQITAVKTDIAKNLQPLTQLKLPK